MFEMRSRVRRNLLAPVSCCMMDENGRAFKFRSKKTGFIIIVTLCDVKMLFLKLACEGQNDDMCFYHLVLKAYVKDNSYL